MEEKQEKITISNQCYHCAYRSSVPGNTHSQCNYNWIYSEEVPPRGSIHGIQEGWYFFPVNYDPVWQETECKVRTNEIDEEMLSSKFDQFKILNAFLKAIVKVVK